MTAGATPSLRFRLAGPADAAAVANLHAESWRASYRGAFSDAYLDGPVYDDRRRVWQARLVDGEAADAVTVLAEGDDGLLGFCCILPRHDPIWGALIDNLHVKPGTTRQRVGRRVLREAASRLAAVDIERPIHLTVLEGNARAIGAYESWGGRLGERLTKREPDGSELDIRLYAWPSARALAGGLTNT